MTFIDFYVGLRFTSVYPPKSFQVQAALLARVASSAAPEVPFGLARDPPNPDEDVDIRGPVPQDEECGL